MNDEELNDLDDDLQDLLNELDSTDDVDVVEQMIEETEEEVDELEDKVQESEEPESEELEEGLEELVEGLDDFDEVLVDAEEEVLLKPTDVREVEDMTDSTTALIEEPVHPSVDVMKYHDKLDLVTTEVLSACRADRQETQDVIDLLRLQIDDAVNKTQTPSRMWVDGLVKAVEVKAGINATAVKIIEANAKMLAATKAGVNILNQNISSGTEDLEDVLSRPLTEDDEF